MRSISQHFKMLVQKHTNKNNTNRKKKSLKVLRTGKPARRILTVSNIPEYLNWFRTTSGSNIFGFYKLNKKGQFGITLIL